MTPDREQLREKVARALHATDSGYWGKWRWMELNGNGRAPYFTQADAVLAVLPTYEQVGWLSRRIFVARSEENDRTAAMNGWEPVYVRVAAPPEGDEG